jgi:hypothetical protein
MKEYSSCLEFDSIFKEAFDMMISKCARFFVNKTNLSDNPTIADDFFSICRRFLTKKKDIFFGSSHLEDLMRILLAGIGLQHKEAVDSHCKFFIDLMQTLRYDCQN